VIDPTTKRSLGQMIKGVQVVAATHDGVTRAYTSHWVSQVAFEEPIVMASVSPKHDTWPLMVASGRFTVSLLAADQIVEGQYFSYPGRRFRYVAPEYLGDEDGHPVVPGCISWFTCEIFERTSMADHELVFGRIVATGLGRLDQPPLLYSSRHGWRTTGGKARESGVSVRDQLLARLDESPTEPGPD
jgi:3-hydroxy-9,10-secoandrosta-1,3,5(10)-triene-9,17-dione monooxygenase reductase component